MMMTEEPTKVVPMNEGDELWFVLERKTKQEVEIIVKSNS